MEDSYTPKEVKEFLKTSRMQIYKLIKLGRLKAFDIAIHNPEKKARPILRISKQSFEEYLASVNSNG